MPYIQGDNTRYLDAVDNSNNIFLNTKFDGNDLSPFQFS